MIKEVSPNNLGSRRKIQSIFTCMSLLQIEKLSQRNHVRKMRKIIWMLGQLAMFLPIEKSMARYFAKLIHTNLRIISAYIKRVCLDLFHS